MLFILLYYLKKLTRGYFKRIGQFFYCRKGIHSIDLLILFLFLLWLWLPVPRINKPAISLQLSGHFRIYGILER
ncbi:hypothetical protein A3H65_01935 [Candidatus Giovannonibacteria bacterium RIFCSPLOWO2_02_FULL_45_14]|nr:MAG: hypothetical protein A3H65_01935 [Candidatus Giovannonibacteria bacterium RIFCSPLOWO2_02_FULL_45_14]